MKKTVLITGTTSGLGYELCKIFARKGFNLVLVSRNDQQLKHQKEELLKNYNISVNSIVHDLSSSASPEKIYAEVKKMKIHIDILVNNAGLNESGPFITTSAEKELQMIQVHIGTLTHLTKLFLPEMISNRYGKIVNIGSTGSFAPCPLDAVYCASKAYILSLSCALNSELAGTGVTVSTVCPGAMNTEFAKKAGMENTLLFKRFVMHPQRVAEIAFKKLMRNQRIIVPGLYNKILVASIPFTPNKILDKVSMFLLKKNNG